MSQNWKRAIPLLIAFALALLVASLPTSGGGGKSANGMENDGVCGECHPGFVPFKVSARMAAGSPPARASTLIASVGNERSHTVSNLTAEMEGAGNGPQPPYESTEKGTAWRGNSNHHQFKVGQWASAMTLRLDGDDGISGMNNLDLYLKGPSGKQWSATGGGPDETLVAGGPDMAEEGEGMYEAEVKYVSGVRRNQYSLAIEVTYGSPGLIYAPGALPKGANVTFSWNLSSGQMTSGNLSVRVTGTVFYEHNDDTIPDSAAYSIAAKAGAPPTSGRGAEPRPRLVWGQALGFTGLGLFAATVLTGYPRAGRRFSLRLIRGRFELHCWIALALTTVAGIHALLLLTGVYAGTTRGLLLGGASLAVFAFLTAAGFLRKWMTGKIGYARWKWLHRWLTVVVLVVLAVHLLSDGSHFRAAGI